MKFGSSLRAASMALLCLLLQATVSHSQTSCPKIGADSLATMEAYVLYQDAKAHLGEPDFKDYATQFRQAAWYVMHEAPGLRKQVFSDAVKFYRWSIAVDSTNTKAYVDTIQQIYRSRTRCHGERHLVMGYHALDLIRFAPDSEEIFPMLDSVAQKQGKDMPIYLVNPYVLYAYNLSRKDLLDQEKAEEALDLGFKIAYSMREKDNYKNPAQIDRLLEQMNRLSRKLRGYWTMKRINDWCETVEDSLYNSRELLYTAIKRYDNLRDKEGIARATVLMDSALQVTTNRSTRISTIMTLSDRYFRAREEEKAISLLKENLEPFGDTVDIGSAKLSYSLAKIYRMKDDLAESKRHLEMALRYYPGWGMAYMLLGDLLVGKTDCDPNDKLHAHFHICAALDAYEAAEKDPKFREDAEQSINLYTKYLSGPEQIFYHPATAGERWETRCWADISVIVRVR